MKGVVACVAAVLLTEHSMCVRQLFQCSKLCVEVGWVLSCVVCIAAAASSQLVLQLW